MRPIVADRHRQLHHRLQVVHLGEALGVGRAGAVAADQRDRARHQAEDRVQVERLRHRDADRVLHQDVGKQHQEEDRERLAALLEHGAGRRTCRRRRRTSAAASA